MSDNIFEFKKPNKTDSAAQAGDNDLAIATTKLAPIVTKLEEALIAEFGENTSFALSVRRNNEPKDLTSKLVASNLTTVPEVFQLLNQSTAYIFNVINTQLEDAVALINTKPVE